MKFTRNRIASLVRQRGYKITPQRRAVLNAIAESNGHLTPAAIYERVHKQKPGIGLVTVYRTLDLLTELGLVCEVHTGVNCRSYLMRRPSEHHHHIICSACGAVVDFTDCDLDELERRICRKTGFEINSHLLEFTGRCRYCRQELCDGGQNR
jgi:Fur family ferric uptake transcriptional regulator